MLPLLTPLLLAAPAFAGTPQQLQFQEVSQAVGIDAIHDMSTDYPMHVMSGGASVGDINGDGIADLFLPSGGIHPDRIYIGKADHTFELVHPWIIGSPPLYRGIGSTMGDFDGDGLVDIFITSVGDLPGNVTAGAHRLYRNLGGGTFLDVALAAGLEYSSAFVADGFGSCFGDYDLDGDLDLFVCGWESSSNGNRLFRNEGDGTFVDVTNSSGIAFTYIRGFSPRFVDMDGDRFPELLIAADFGTTTLFRNQRDGTFLDITTALKPDKVHYGMGQAVGDFDGDLQLDWYVTSIFFDNPGPFIPNGNRLYLYRGADQPMQATPPIQGVDNGGWGWGTVAGDFDLDGDMDLAEVNGWQDSEWHAERTYLYLNDGTANFTEAGATTGFDDVGQGRGLLSFDYQNDGDLDLFILGPGERVKLYRNDQDLQRHWLRVDVDSTGNPNLAPLGHGTKIYVSTAAGDQVQSLDGGANYLGCSQMTTLFGLDQETTADKVIIVWADGFRTLLTDVSADQIVEVAAIPPLEVDVQIQRGQSFDTALQGVLPGEKAWFFASLSGTTPHGQAWPSLGGLRSDLKAPVILLGDARADADGIAHHQAQLPAWLPSLTLSVQAYVPRGPGGNHSLKSNVVQRTILP